MPYFIIACVCSMAIFWQDVKTREVHLIPIVLLAASGLMTQWQLLGQIALISMGINLSFIICMQLCVLLIFRFKGERQIMDRLLGWGDIVTLAALAAWMEPPGFLFFYTTSTLVIAFVCSVLRWTGRMDSSYPIPLAGWLSLLFTCYQSYLYLC